MGHVRDLPKGAKTSGKKNGAKAPTLAQQTKGMSTEEKADFKKKRDANNLVRRMGIDPEGGWSANYEVLPGKEKVVSELKRLAATSEKKNLSRNRSG